MGESNWADRSQQIEQLLAAARAGEGQALGELLQTYRNYLMILATNQFDRRLRQRLNPSDLVQEAMLAVHRDFAKFRGHAEGEFLAWLRKILIHCLHRAIETHVRAKRRDVRRDISIEEFSVAVDRSVSRISQRLADAGPSPGTAIALADQLAKLPADYREMLVLRNLQGLSFNEIAHRTGRSCGAVRMLWLRAIARFKQLSEVSDSSKADRAD